jgi:lipid-A-disaccharide synthase
VHLLEGDTYALLNAAEAALVTSGTATLETALIGTPQVVVYKANPLSVWIARRLVKVKFISLVNLIMDREVVTELIQQDVNAKRVRQELNAILPSGVKHQQVLDDYASLKQKLGGEGASRITATALLKILDEAK